MDPRPANWMHSLRSGTKLSKTALVLRADLESWLEVAGLKPKGSEMIADFDRVVEIAVTQDGRHLRPA